MRLGEKLVHLRYLEGVQRGLGRPMSKAEVVRAMRQELGESISHPYLCQLESGSRVHMTGRTRELLARFFRVLPGYLVDDPEGFEVGLRTGLPQAGDRLQDWLLTQAELLQDEPEVAHVLLKLSRVRNPRRFFAILDRLLELPPSQFDLLESQLREWSETS